MTPKPFACDGLSPPLSPRHRTAEDCIQNVSTETELPLSLVVLGVYGQMRYKVKLNEGENEAMRRYRLNTTDPSAKDYDPGMMVPIDGLLHPDGHQRFYHNNNEMYERKDKVKHRDVLFQSLENYETISRDPMLKKYFHLHDTNNAEDAPLTLTNAELLKERTLRNTRFGEQVIVQGTTPHDISVGDVFEVADGKSTLKIEVSSPRKPCYWLDTKNETPKGLKGVKARCLNTGLAGWFTRVLVAGELHDGMVLVRTDHPHPKWTLANISQALFGGEGDPGAFARGRASWGRSKQELQELLDLGEVLGCMEWRDELAYLMDQIEEKGKEEIVKKTTSPLFESILGYFSTVLESMCSIQRLGCFDEELACGAF